MSLPALFAIDIAAILLLVFGLYFPRHRRRDMIVAFLGINVGVLAVTQALASAEVSAGFGLGLFGVLSIIRLRSAEMDQEEVAYYFASLALGLLGGFRLSPQWLSPLLTAALLVAVFVGDHPRLFRRYDTVQLTLDQAYTSDVELQLRLVQLLDAKIHHAHVRKIDLVEDTTTVEVRYERREVESRASAGSA